MDEFRQWVQKDKIEKAFELFDYESFMDKEDRNMLVQLQARYKSFQKEKMSGTESFETLERTKRKLISDSLNWTSDLEDE